MNRRDAAHRIFTKNVEKNDYVNVGGPRFKLPPMRTLSVYFSEK